MSGERVTFTTDDGVRIAAEYTEGPQGGPAALLLHMMPAVKEGWRPFTERLLAAGFTNVLAIDLRGHGESTEGADGARLDYRLFDDAEHQAKMRDVEAAVRWLEREKGVTTDRLVVVGASIGANLAIAYGAAHNEVPAVAALSPGLDYRGVTTDDKVTEYADGQGLYLAASGEDELSFRTDRRLAELRPESVVMEFSGAGHGTTIFESEPAFMDTLAAWLRDNA